MNTLLMKMRSPPEIKTALQGGASLVIAISGSKDSNTICELLPLLDKSHGWTGKQDSSTLTSKEAN
jgi:hypothetical protein